MIIFRYHLLATKELNQISNLLESTYTPHEFTKSLDEEISKNKNIVIASFKINAETYLSAISYKNNFYLGIYNYNNNNITFNVKINSIIDKDYFIRIINRLTNYVKNNIQPNYEINSLGYYILRAWEETYPLLDKVIEVQNSNCTYERKNDQINHLVAEYEAVQAIKQYYRTYGCTDNITVQNINFTTQSFVQLTDDHKIVFSKTCPKVLKSMIVNACCGFEEVDNTVKNKCKIAHEKSQSSKDLELEL